MISSSMLETRQAWLCILIGSVSYRRDALRNDIGNKEDKIQLKNE